MFPCSYDDEADKVNQYQRLNLDGLEKIEIGKTLESTRAEVRISALAESPDTSQKCARQFLCNRLAVSPQKMIHAQRTLLKTDVTSCVSFARPGTDSFWEAQVLLHAPALQERRDEWILSHSASGHAESGGRRKRWGF